jgi:hypothetical protein
MQQQQDGGSAQPPDGDQQQQQQQLQVAPYSCPACCRKLAEESRMDLLHLHAVLLADTRPAKPRTAAEIFAAEFARKVGARTHTACSKRALVSAAVRKAECCCDTAKRWRPLAADHCVDVSCLHMHALDQFIAQHCLLCHL